MGTPRFKETASAVRQARPRTPTSTRTGGGPTSLQPPDRTSSPEPTVGFMPALPRLLRAVLLAESRTDA